MLVLTRKKQERIQIGDGITVTVLRIKGKTVRLGIEAPEQCNILRGELTINTSPDASPDRSILANRSTHRNAASPIESDRPESATRPGDTLAQALPGPIGQASRGRNSGWEVQPLGHAPKMGAFRSGKSDRYASASTGSNAPLRPFLEAGK